jgi:hypothetical protein
MYSLSGGVVHFLPPVAVIQDRLELRSGTGSVWRAYAGEGIGADVIRQRFVFGRPELAHMVARIPAHEDEGLWIRGDARQGPHVADGMAGHGEEVVGTVGEVVVGLEGVDCEVAGGVWLEGDFAGFAAGVVGF